MNAQTSMKSDWFCPIACWTVAASGGLLTAVLLSMIDGFGLIAVVFLGGVACAAGGILLQRAMCTGAEVPPVGAHTVPGGGATTRPAPAAPSTRAETRPDTSSEAQDEARPEETPEDQAPGTVSATVQAAAESVGAVVGKAAGAVEKAATSVVAAVVSATPALKGEEDLRSRKGTWRYQGPTGDQPGDAPGADYDGDGTSEGADEGSKPPTLPSAREGGADNLKEIKGIGPKLEKLLNEMGFYHFDQIGSWSEDEIAWVNANLEGFRGRVTRDDWVSQARVLASGGDTEFSRRVEEGDVY